jgi:sucrose-6-phosphate hydrolase SacC (GH32 family)
MKQIRTLLGALLLVPLVVLQAAEPSAKFHYQPDGAVFGDPIPFQHGGIWHVFYLRRAIDSAGAFLAGSALEWYHIASHDLVHWKELPPALLADETDRMIATGSIVEKDGVFHAFYSTRNHAEKGPGLAAVRVATSRDLVTWTKQPGEPLLLLKRDVPALGTYESDPHFRDPHVFWNPQAKEWWLAIAAQQKLDPPYPYAGAVAVATSSDLRKWMMRREPMLASRESPASECPDVFPFGKGWALIYYADTTRIRLAEILNGPWHRPANDAPWGLHLHAAKTMSDGNRRILIGFIPRVASDYAEHKYGGVMALPRELYADEKGRPAVRLVPEVMAACQDDATAGQGPRVFVPAKPDPVSVTETALTFAPKAGESALANWIAAPADYFLTTDLMLSEGASLTLLLRRNQKAKQPGSGPGVSLDDSYALTLDARNQVVTLRRHDGWNRMPNLRSQTVALPTGRPVKLHLMLDGNVLEAFVDDRISISARVQLATGGLTLLARDGTVQLRQLRIARLPSGKSP